MQPSNVSCVLQHHLVNLALILASIHFIFLAAVLMILLATLLMQTCLLVFPLACVLAPVCLLGKVSWPRRYWLPFIGSFRSSAAVNHQQQQTAVQAFRSSIQTFLQTLRSGIRHKRLKTTGPSTHQHDTSLPSMKQAVLGLLSFKWLGREVPCLICLEDIAISKILHLEGCDHSYCMACTAMHLQTKLRDDQHDILCCPFPECTSVLTVVQSQALLSHDAAVITSSRLRVCVALFVHLLCKLHNAAECAGLCS